jgi:hemoglobin
MAVMAAVSLFYDKVLADDLTSPFFGGLDMDQQTKKQLAFMSWAFGGPEEYKDRPLREAHAKLVADGLSDEHFDAVVEHLRSTLVELDIQEPLILEVLEIVEATRSEVLGR